MMTTNSWNYDNLRFHYNDVKMSAMASEINGVPIVCSAVCSGADKRKHQRSASLAFVRGIQRLPLNSPHKGPVTRKMLPFDDVIMFSSKTAWHRFPGAHCYTETRKGRQGDCPGCHWRRWSCRNVCSDDQGSHSDDLSVSVYDYNTETLFWLTIQL